VEDIFGQHVNISATFDNSAGWYLTYALCHFLAPVVTTIIVSTAGFIADSNVFFFFVTLLLHTMGTVAMIFTILPLCPGSKSADLFPLLAMLAPGIGLYMAVVASDFPPGFFWPSCLVPTAAAPLGISLFIRSEMDGKGLTSLTQGDFPLLGVWLFQLFDVVLCLLLAWYFDQVLPAPTTTGDRKQWNFCLPLWIRGGAPAPEDTPSSPVASGSGSVFVKVEAAVKVQRLKKTYAASPAPVHAVVDVSFEMANGEVTGLLGQNGAGKTTAINVLCGLVRPTSGEATVHGLDATQQIDKVRAISGVCPQHDLLFDELSVSQHIDLYAGIKGLERERAHEQVAAWLERLDMGHKMSTRAEQLSGGQRRKVSLVVALLGDPKFVLLDEPTAGMDPQSRRAVWEFVSASKAGRATLLTTHFMDEADVLCGSIVVVSKGLVAAVGSPSDLKARYASGYHLVAATKAEVLPGQSAEESVATRSSQLLAVAQKHVAEAKLEDASAEQASITLPSSSSASFSALFHELDTSSAEFGVTSYGVSLPSMQEAFLQILDAQKGVGGYADSGQADDAQNQSAVALSPSHSDADVLGYSTPSTGSQLRIVLSKLFMEVKADCLMNAVTYTAVSALIVFAYLIGILVTPSNSEAAPTDAPTAVTLSPLPFASVHAGYPLPYLPPTGSFASVVEDSAPGGLRATYGYTPAPSHAPVDASDPSGPHRALSENISVSDGAFAAYALPGGMAGGSTLLYNSSYWGSLAAFAPLFEQALIDVAAPGLTITPRLAALPTEDTDESAAASSAALTLQIAPLMTIFAMLVIVGITSKRIADERFHNTKQLLLLSGLDVRMFWAGYFVNDWLQMMLLLVGVGTIAAGASGAVVGEALPALVLCTTCAIPGVIFVGYLVTLPFKNYDEAAGFIMIVFMLFGLLPTIFIAFLTDRAAKLALSVILLLAPPNQVITGIISVLTLQQISARQVDYGGDALAASDYFRVVYSMDTFNMQTGAVETGTNLGPGLTIIVACCSNMLLGALFYFIEIRRFTVPRPPKPALAMTPHEQRSEDPDVSAERARVAGLAEDVPEAAVRVEGLTKEFYVDGIRKIAAAIFPCFDWGGKKLRAVDSLTLAIPSGTCFALLGPNGAGKTTAINVLTGEYAPTAGQSSLQGISTSSSLTEVFQITGFCPQLKGVWQNLTLRQHLTILLRLKGLTGRHLEVAIAEVEKGYGLEEHAHKKAKNLSGGTQRKLSAAMALSCGSPKIVFVDEPTTGVDVGTRRFIWDRIKEASRDRVVVLTTHYMDEADALAQRIGIMAAGKMRVLGSPQHLKSRHGGGYRVELKAGTTEASADPKAAAKAAEEALTALVEQHFTGVRRVPSHQGTLIFEVAQGFALATVFGAFEDAKMSLGLETFTMSQTSLEDVFLRVAAAHKFDTMAQVHNPSATAAAAPNGYEMSGAEMERDAASGLVQEGYYVNKCLNVWVKVTPNAHHTSEAPGYKGQCMCFMYMWILPVPCCCCPPWQLKMEVEDGDERTADEEGAEVYKTANGKEKHVWKKAGAFKQDGPFGSDTFTRRR